MRARLPRSVVYDVIVCVGHGGRLDLFGLELL